MSTTLLRRCRLRSGDTLRSLAARAGTSHATLAAYEAGRKVPSAATLERILRAAGFELEVRPLLAAIDEATRGEELQEVLALAAMFPARHDPVLQAPIFGRR